jgi:hypothetical protein
MLTFMTLRLTKVSYFFAKKPNLTPKWLKKKRICGQNWSHLDTFGQFAVRKSVRKKKWLTPDCTSILVEKSPENRAA